MKKARTEVNCLLNELCDATYNIERGGFTYAAGYMQSMLTEILTDMPMKKQKYYMDQLQGSIDKANMERKIAGNMTAVRL